MTTLLVFYLLSTAVGTLVGGAFNTVSGALGGLGKTAASAAQTAAPALANVSDPLTSINQALRGSMGNDPGALRDAASAAVRALVTGDQGQAADARERAAQALARAQNVPVEEASASPVTSNSIGRPWTKPSRKQRKRPIWPLRRCHAEPCSAAQRSFSAPSRRGSAGVWV